MIEYDNFARQLEFANYLNNKNKAQPCKKCESNKEGWCTYYKSWCSTAKHKCSIINQ